MATPVAVVRARASSVLDGHGAQHLCSTAGSEECWRSQPLRSQGSHRLELQLGAPARVRAVRLQFQGGFASARVAVWLRDADSGEWVDAGVVEPADTNRSQDLALDASRVVRASAVRLRLGELADMFGRCVVYVLVRRVRGQH